MLTPIAPFGLPDFVVTLAGGTDVVLSDHTGGWNGTDRVVVRVTGDIGASSTSVPALDIDISGNVLLIVNSGVTVEGEGGAGGDGGISSIDSDGAAGDPGGPALIVRSGATLSIRNEGTIAGGGGGGGEGGGGGGRSGGNGGQGAGTTQGATGEAGTAGIGSAGSGGDGGDLGQAGDAGQSGDGTSGGTGGAAGDWIQNSGTVTAQNGAGVYAGGTTGL